MQMRRQRTRAIRTVSNPLVSEEEEDDRPEVYRDDIDESLDEDNEDDPDFEPVGYSGFLSSAEEEDQPAAPEYRGSVPTKKACKKTGNSRASLGKEIYHEFSITFSRLSEDLPEAEFHKGADYLDDVLQWFTCVYEQGDEEGHWHAQCTGGGINMDKSSAHTGLKNTLGWTGQNKSSTWNLVVK